MSTERETKDNKKEEDVTKSDEIRSSIVCTDTNLSDGKATTCDNKHPAGDQKTVEKDPSTKIEKDSTTTTDGEAFPEKNHESAQDLKANKKQRKGDDARKKPKKKTGDQQKTISTKITDFFPVRRSSRKTEVELKKKKSMEMEKSILKEEEDGLEIKISPAKGRGVVATKPFEQGDFVVEYRGDLIKREDAKKRNDEYSKDEDVGSYMYYFIHKDRHYCVDATAETPYLGRLINHSAKKPNLVTKVVEAKNTPHLVLVASRDIMVGEELLYDYGDRDKATVLSNPWLKDS